MVAEKYVKRGIELLDTKSPSWKKKININDLFLELGLRCILGQNMDLPQIKIFMKY